MHAHRSCLLVSVSRGPEPARPVTFLKEPAFISVGRSYVRIRAPPFQHPRPLFRPCHTSRSLRTCSWPPTRRHIGQTRKDPAEPPWETKHMLRRGGAELRQNCVVGVSGPNLRQGSNGRSGLRRSIAPRLP